MNEFSARLPSVIVGLGCVLITILIGQVLLGNTAGILGGVIQISTFVYWRECRTAELDLYLTFFISLAMLSFCRMYFGRSRWSGWVLLFWISLGCAGASKSVLCVLPALGTCGLALWLCRDKAYRNRLDRPRGFWTCQASLSMYSALRLTKPTSPKGRPMFAATLMLCSPS